MKTDFWRAAKLLLAQLLNLDINEQLAREVDYLRTENQVLKSQLKEKGKRLKFTEEQRRQLVIKAKALWKRLFEVVTIVRPETILLWHKKLIAQKFDSSKVKRKVGRPKVDVEIKQFVLKFSRENKPWGVCAFDGYQKKVVAGPRIELGTRGFSVLVYISFFSTILNFLTKTLVYR